VVVRNESEAMMARMVGSGGIWRSLNVANGV
jgi:hypothetical protein